MMLWAVGLLLLALFLLALELFVPSAGMLGVLAGLCLMASIVVAFMDSTRMGLVMTLVSLIILPTVLVVAMYVWPNTPIGKLIVIARPESPDVVLPDTDRGRIRKTLVGRIGMTTTKMLPSGEVVVDGQEYDAVSAGMALEAGQTIEVVDIRGNRIVVKPTARTPQPDQDLLQEPFEGLDFSAAESPSDRGPGTAS